MTFPGAMPTLTDGVVTLRSHRPADVEGVLAQALDAESIRWTTVPTPYSRSDAEEFVGVHARAWLEDEAWGFAAEFEGAYAGSLSLRHQGRARAEVSYGSTPVVRGVVVDGRSVMERALRLLLEWGFAERSLETVIWWANAGNWASRRLAWKVGFSFDGTVRGWLDHRGTLVDGWVGTLRAGEALAPREPWSGSSGAS